MRPSSIETIVASSFDTVLQLPVFYVADTLFIYLLFIYLFFV